MKKYGTVAVMGANGRTGRILVQTLLDAGYFVQAGVHRSDQHVPRHERVVIVPTDVRDANAVAELLSGTSAVLSALGHSLTGSGDLQTVAMQNIIDTNRLHNVKRVITLTGTGVRERGDTPHVLDTVMNTMMGFIARARMRDGERHVRVLQRSELQWTILRVLFLTNGEAHAFGLTPHGPAQLSTSRATVAQAFVRVLEQPHYLFRSPVISSIDAVKAYGEEHAEQHAQARARVYSSCTDK